MNETGTPAREIGDTLDRVGRHRRMLAELIEVQLRTLLELKDLLAGDTAPPEVPALDVDMEVRRTIRAARLLAEAARPAKRQVPKVLLVDDDPTTRNIISHFLRREEFIVEKAADGHDGLAKARSGRPDLLIIDAVVPGLGGFELLTCLRKDAATVAIPVLMLSALGEEDAIIKGLEEGADYLVKPFSPQVLVAKIKKILREQVDHAIDRRPL